ncbi:stamen-specific protein FIL1-like [Juglans microcarpa x Juglans regia]|uniref:stamen-specific protein FIL1-like n=1 Tax=Juglans microcarpa x Juglans regia TaxID=2249226 RepID=UPI001B7DB0A0|nr:stamen-specific protein FIL1-like [Juglans microcarpa x Juglans regia]
MAALKSLVSVSSQVAVLLVLLMALAVQTQTAQAQTCAASLNNLNVCTPFVLPGAANTSPSPACCGALQAVPNDCLCSTLRIVARLPAQCNLPSRSSCGNSSCCQFNSFHAV